jgi:hypothetical protein
MVERSGCESRLVLKREGGQTRTYSECPRYAPPSMEKEKAILLPLSAELPAPLPPPGEDHALIDEAEGRQ